MIVILTLGNVIFQDFEIPDTIKAGGAQKLDAKKFIGGTRTIDALGRDDDNIEWSGRFRGPTATARCQQLNAMRIAGKQVKVTWDSFSYQVLIDKFTFDYQQPFEIPYKISLMVLIDNNFPAQQAGPSLFASFLGKLSDSLGITDTLSTLKGDFDSGVASLGITGGLSGLTTTIDGSIPEITSTLNDLQSTVATVNSLTGAKIPLLNSISADIVSAQGITQTAISALNGQLAPVAGSLFGGIAGLPPQTIVANVFGQASAIQNLANLTPLSDVLGVMSKDMKSAATDDILWNQPSRVNPVSPATP